MPATKLVYVNKFTGDIKVVTKQSAKQLSEDWAKARMATNREGKKVFRFELSAPVKAKDGKRVMGTAVVDVSETGEQEVVDVESSTK